jgi:hypothetical protein
MTRDSRGDRARAVRACASPEESVFPGANHAIASGESVILRSDGPSAGSRGGRARHGPRADARGGAPALGVVPVRPGSWGGEPDGVLSAAHRGPARPDDERGSDAASSPRRVRRTISPGSAAVPAPCSAPPPDDSQSPRDRSRDIRPPNSPPLSSVSASRIGSGISARDPGHAPTHGREGAPAARLNPFGGTRRDVSGEGSAR